ncbi:hypothetical protein [Stenotrophomonas sp. UBA7606]|uniref:hypothetical protein n=1 Tax=Stenotrophomonas sp. UBA7606 TaxID=1947559 RepID=UPI0025E4F3E0|nr:hypothetical protein [Stenotrophomonas sp. UBA7606]
MTPEQFTYWMQGFAELNALPPSPEQWQSIREHLALVFEKKTAEFKPNPSLGINPQFQPGTGDVGKARDLLLCGGGVLKC